jgi:gluconate 2-dehydrogenase gamma chain
MGLPGMGVLAGCLPARKSVSSPDLLSVVCGRLLPSDDGPGAREANVAEYVQKALSGHYASYLQVIQEGLGRVDRLARREWESPFVRLSPSVQDRILRFVQKGGEDDDDFRGGVFVHRLLELCLEGFLGDPRHGGNRNGAGWRYIGFAPPGPCREKNR